MLSLRGQRPDFRFETLVVDSAADPGVMAVGAEFPEVRLVRGDRDLLAGPARNLGVSQARGEYVAFIDADCVAESAWLANAMRALEAGAEMVGGPVLDALPWHPVAVTDNLLQFADFPSGRPEGSARYFPGCNMALRKTTFLSAGGFSEEEIVAGEDTRLCDEVRERWPRGLHFARGMRVRHDGRQRFTEFLRHQRSFGYVRGALGIHVSTFQQRWGRRRVSMPIVVGKRFVYIIRRSVTWDPLRSPRLVLLAPLIVAGLVAWWVGFRRGCRESRRWRAATREAVQENRKVRPR